MQQWREREKEKTNNNDTFSFDFQPQQKCLTSSRSLAFYHGMAFVLYIQKLMKVFHIMKRQTRSTIAAAFQLCFHFWGCFTPLQHTPEHSYTHTYIFFCDFSRHSVFWVSGLCIDSFSGNACVMSAPATGRPARWIRYTLPTTAPTPLLLGVIHRDNRNVTCLRGVGNMPLHRGKKRTKTIFSNSVKWQRLRERYV